MQVFGRISPGFRFHLNTSIPKYNQRLYPFTNSCWFTKGNSRIVAFLSTLYTKNDAIYDRVYKYSIEDATREKFWEIEAEKLTWEKKWESTLDMDSIAPSSLWFPGGLFNMCYNTVDVHVENGRGDQTAVIFDSAYTGVKKSLTYSELLTQVKKFAGVLTKYGCMYDGKKTRTVLIYMPNSIEAIISMLACARIGAPHAVVFGGFASQELAVRIKHCKPHIIVSSSCGIEPKGIIPYSPLLTEALNIAGVEYHPKKCIIYQRDIHKAQLNETIDTDWKTEMEDAKAVPAVPVSSNHPLYILYTSGTTGDPKGLVRDTAGYAVALHWSMQYIFHIKRGEVFWAASDVGWVVGHSYIVYGPLLRGATTVIFEGKPVGTPDSAAYWRMIEEYKVKALFCAPTALRAIKRDDPHGSMTHSHNMESLEALFLAGERADPDTVHWASTILNRPVIDNYWQTETGWPIVSNFMNLQYFPIKEGSATKPVPGFNLHVLDKDGNQVAPDTLGNICLKRPLPPGCFVSLWNSEKKLSDSSYFRDNADYYHTGDSGYKDVDNYVYIMTRTGDIINVAGHRLSTGSVEEIISSHPAVAECAVIGIFDEVKGQVPLGFVIIKAGVEQPEAEIIKEIIHSVRTKFGAVSFFKNAIIVEKLPKTRSGKILRGIIQKIASGESFKFPATIEDVSAIDHVHAKLLEHGFKPHAQF